MKSITPKIPIDFFISGKTITIQKANIQLETTQMVLPISRTSASNNSSTIYQGIGPKPRPKPKPNTKMQTKGAIFDQLNFSFKEIMKQSTKEIHDEINQSRTHIILKKSSFNENKT